MFLALLFAEVVNFSYLCIVDEDERRSAVGSGKYLSGSPKFSPCPERKNREDEIDIKD